MPTYTTKTAQETKDLASKILKELPKKGILCLYGQLGAGKTTFTKGLAQALGLNPSSIKSPTYTYVREHIVDITQDKKTTSQKIFHCDLYRLEKHPAAAAELIGELLLREPDLLIIEWAEHLGPNLPKHRTDIHFNVKNEKREIKVQHHRA